MVTHTLENVPDTVKVAGAVAAPTLSMFGITIEEWTFVLSAVVSVLFIIEKLPMLITRARTFIQWIRKVRKS